MRPWLALTLRWGAPWAAGLATVGVAGLGVVATGAFDTTATTPHAAAVAWATHETMVNAVRRQAARLPDPPPFTDDDVVAGAQIYDANCVTCHGAPGVAHAAWTSGMTPAPPYLLDVARQFSPKQLYWIVRHGVKMTGMPAWQQTLSSHDVWQVVAFLDALPDISAQGYQQARRPPALKPPAVDKPPPG